MDALKLSQLINRRISDTVNVFGVESNEYKLVEKTVLNLFRDDLEMMLTSKKDGSIRIAQLPMQRNIINTIGIENELERIKAHLERQGSIAKRASIYFEGIKRTEIPRMKNEIREMANFLYRNKAMSDNFYDELSTLDDTDEFGYHSPEYEEAMREFRNRKGLHGKEAEEQYYEAVRAVMRAFYKSANEKMKGKEEQGGTSISSILGL